MSDTQALAAFLLARIEEDETSARRHAAAAREGLSDGEPLVWWGRVADRILAECGAKRRILGQVFDLDPGDGYTEATRDAVLQLAAVYDGHPDYEPDWQPEQDYTRPHDSPRRMSTDEHRTDTPHRHRGDRTDTDPTHRTPTGQRDRTG